MVRCSAALGVLLTASTVLGSSLRSIERTSTVPITESAGSPARVEDLPLGTYELYEYNPVALPANVVVSGKARFTVLTDRIIRMEYASSEKFEDRATMAFVHRATPAVKFTQSTTSGVLTITTDKIALSYTVGQTFSAASLVIKSLDSTSAFKSWSYGQANPGVLHGTLRSLDDVGNITLNCADQVNHMVHDEHLHCSDGILSRDGWAIIDDSENVVLNAHAEWLDGYNADSIDQYMFAYGHDYTQALSDFTQIGGKIAMVPRSAFGIWYTRWYDFNFADTRRYVDDYESRDLPLDIWIYDMNWHTKYAWGGYTPDERLFPFPGDTFGYLTGRGIDIGCNLHDDTGVLHTEAQHGAMAAALGLPASTGDIPLNIVNETYMNALEDIVFGAVVKQGMLIAWSDWQQGGAIAGAKGLAENPTIIINKVRGTEHFRRGEAQRALHLARWGGVGNHRYQIGFSGDVAGLTWTNLAYQPYFSSTASNIGFGFWSHDIEGPGDDHEMYVRWVQWASVSSIFRTHDRGMSAGGCANSDSCSSDRPWEVPTKYFEANRLAMRTRALYVPYLYTAARQAFDSGVGLTRPLYYAFPEEDMAYASNSAGEWAQYMLGDDIMCAPVVIPSGYTQMANVTIWVPPGMWYNDLTGEMHDVPTGGMKLSRAIDLTETPKFIRAGAVIPFRPLTGSSIGVARSQYETLGFAIFPGATTGSGSAYEDDATTTAYVSGASAVTTLSYNMSGTTGSFKISTDGSYDLLPSTRTYMVSIRNSLPPTSVDVGGTALSYSRFQSTQSSWTYHGEELETVITVTGVTVSSGVSISVVFPSSSLATKLSGLKGAFSHSILAKSNFDMTRTTPGAHQMNGQFLMEAASTADALSYLAGTNFTLFEARLNAFPLLWNNTLAEVETMIPASANALLQLWSGGRQDHVLCGSSDCRTSNTEYGAVRVEGYMPAAGSDTIPFNDFWNNKLDDTCDNWATTNATTPTGYSPATFSNGVVYKTQQPGSVPLQLFYSSSRQDHMAVATDAGVADAKASGYTLVDAALGYVLTDPPTDGLSASLVTHKRWAYSWALLNSVTLSL